ncbi:MAG: FecR domain-containing protein [Polyangiaceae bacterium]
MRETEEPSELSPVAGRLVKLAHQELGAMSPRLSVEGFLRLNARRSRGSRSNRVKVMMAAALLLALAGGGLGLARLTSQRALTCALQGGSISADGAIEANGAVNRTLRFSDGTQVAFLAGARGRVKAIEARGARIAIAGKVDVAVAHAHGSRWLFDAGPYLIEVTGTAFTAEWNERDERLEVSLRSGSVTLTGPRNEQPIFLRAGRRLTISRDNEVVIRDLHAPEEVGAGHPTPNTSSSQSQSAVSSPSAIPLQRPAAPPSAAAVAAPSWANELAAGHFDTILEQAERRGLEATLAEASSVDLAALSDAARYRRRDDIARRALIAQRRRFLKSPRANDAAFLLGRLEEAGERTELALDWYERCLNEAPAGVYVSEALGRKMTLMKRRYGASRARPVAEEYLRRFANGTYAAAARALVRELR